MSIAINDQKFNDLKAKLRELFELDKSDLDFGIYRIMAAKNKEVTEFLDVHLRGVVRDTLASHGAGTSDQVQADLDKAIAQAQALGADPDTLPKVKELKAKLSSAGGASAAELEADIYNHLFAFFSRYYSEGDFISRRRYKGDTYAIPYSGEEVALHWANKDQYYIKSGEWHQDYRFKLHNGKSVRFKLVAATSEVNNNKESDQAKRRYILRDTDPITASGKDLILNFEFRLPTEAEKNRAGDGAVAIFGGKYAAERGSTKGDEREQFCADAEKRALAATPADWLPAVQKVIADGPNKTATDTKPLRTILGKQLDDFTARNTFDYFIHKDLGGFLSRELDFYIKNEVVRLDDLESLPPDHLLRVQGKVKAIRAVASRVIAFLASVENFQKKLWTKKKLVLDTSWLVTIDLIPDKLRDVVAANSRQWEEWERLGFKPAAAQSDLFSNAKWGTREYLDVCDHLVVDTALFDSKYPTFKSDLLSSETLDGQFHTASTLVNGDNFHALSLLQATNVNRVNVLYLDPPYNTDAGPIMYKNGFRSSSWMTMIQDRLIKARPLLVEDGVTCMTIDDYQVHELAHLLDSHYGKDRELGAALIRNNPSGRSTVSGFSVTHEYALFYGNSPKAVVARLPRSKKQLARFTTENGVLVDWRNFRKDGGDVTHRSARPKQFFPLYVQRTDGVIRVPQMTWDKANREWIVDEEPTAGEAVVLPIDDRGQERVWSLNSKSTRNNLKDLLAKIQPDGDVQVLRRHYPSSGILPRTWWSKKEYAAREHGTAQLKRMFGGRSKFSFAKAPAAVRDCLVVCGLASAGEKHVVDYFAGSGTTGQAVIDLNRLNRTHHRFTLIEMGRYFHTVLKPRICKSIYSPSYKGGKAVVHGHGLSALVKCLAVESYDDALNNLPAPGELLPGADATTKAAMLQYSLDLQLGPKLLNLDAFADPWNYHIHAQPAGEEEVRPHRVDLVETFNYLIGLKVGTYGPIERYDAEFEQANHADHLGRLKIKGRLRKINDGRFVFQRVDGELLDGTRVLVVWRKLTTNPDEDAAALDAWMSRHREETKERTEHRDYHLIYMNGPVTLPQPTSEIRTVWPLEETFKDKMFEEVVDG